MPHTAEEKNKLLERFEAQAQQRRAALQGDLDRLCLVFQDKIERRTSRIPKKFMDLRIKDVLGVEREQKLRIYSVLKDIRVLQTQSQASLHKDKEMQREIARMQKAREANVKKVLKRKESLATGRVSKPKKC